MIMEYQIVSDTRGKAKAVIVSLKDFKKIQEDLDEFEAIKEYDLAKKEKLTFRPLEVALKDIEAKRAKRK
jgi:PHD/YefM family antitoxin component YafN of YafNO toxin-antitoxin module